MPDRFPPINPKFPHFMHGGDYNPDQWIDTPEVWDEDIRLMKLAGCNTMSVGIFSWASLEPEEGRFTFEWMDAVLDKLAKKGAYAVLATPSGSKPAWISVKYPESCRVRADGVREPHGDRHNHCRTSPAYRAQCVRINTELARRYRSHPALLVWHVSNEYNGGECYCDLCLEAFRTWLRARYNNDLGELNRKWWTRFWSHTFTKWDQIRPGDPSIHGLTIDWKRFISDQMLGFFKAESAPLRELTPDIPITTNFMGTYTGLNYWKFADAVDVVSWDSYPPYHDRDGDWRFAQMTSFTHDLNRCIKGGKPFMQMECSPSVQNWKPVNKLKRPGLHRVEALQSVAHGSDTVQYFQWRKSRGGCEKFHGAVVDHCGHEHTRVFREVADVGRILSKLDGVIGTTVKPEVAMVYDWENRWAIDATLGPRNQKKEYFETCVNHYGAFWLAGVPVDVINMDCDFSPYRLIVAPMLYMVRPGVAERLERFVADGGTAVFTYLSGIADESDLCFLGGFPGPLRAMLGIWSEEIDVLYDDETNTVAAVEGLSAGLSGAYDARIFCDIIHTEGADVLATYQGEFYAGSPAVTVNTFGRGQAYYIASRNDDRFHTDFYGRLVERLGVRRIIHGPLPTGVTAQVRTDGRREFVFLLNFTRDAHTIDLGSGRFTDMDTGAAVTGAFPLAGYGSTVLTRG
ncbi:MAG: beta-galactosidase [Candidatus Hydrogenedentes bacterium]|nr:beta-galactosidase [Candidatus Hydrogenedentota bacterium]